jgi:hypothetical protein
LVPEVGHNLTVLLVPAIKIWLAKLQGLQSQFAEAFFKVFVRNRCKQNRQILCVCNDEKYTPSQPTFLKSLKKAA